MCYRAKGGDMGAPRGHVKNPLTLSEDSFAMFDVANYQHRPLDRGFLVAPSLPVSKDPLCIR